MLLHAISTLSLAATVYGATQSDAVNPFVPVRVECPQGLNIRPASEGLSAAEKSWREQRSSNVLHAVEEYLQVANISGLNVQEFISKLNTSNVPVAGLAVSGGGTQSGIGGLGIWQAFDARYPQAIAARTGGLSQVLSYITGLSGGGCITVSAIASNNFTSMDSIRQAVNFSVPYDLGPTGNSKTYYTQIFDNTGAKAEAGFPVSVVDSFGQFWANHLPDGGLYSNYSDLARSGNAFSSGHAPMPIMLFAEVVPGKSPEIGGMMYPGRTVSNGFNLTTYEVNPFEFGSWAGGRVQAFMPTQYLGSQMSNGIAQNQSECVRGFDKFTLLQGSTGNAFTAWLIDAFYNIPIFTKRQEAQDIPIPPDQYDNPLVQLVNITATNFNLTFNESMWARYPNPFQNYNEDMTDVSELLIVDGSLSGETDPIRPLIIPAREVDFIIVYEASSEAEYNWNNGTTLGMTARSASEGNMPFPTIPDVNTMATQNLTKQPTFFGCNEDTPLVLYLPNSPWSGYTNYSFTTPYFTDNQLDLALENTFNLATYGNGTIDPQWPECLACATIRGSARKLSYELPQVCDQCFARHCWNGTTSTAEITPAELDPSPRLNSILTYQEWNTTMWNKAIVDTKNTPSTSGATGVLKGTIGHAAYPIMLGLLHFCFGNFVEF